VLGITTYWFCNKQFYTQNIHDSIRDVIVGISFLSLFIIQKAFNRFSGALHLKVNELVASNTKANNAIINVEEKTEREINELTKDYAEIAELAREIDAKL
jgi:low affinity Fe/Cu permease